MGVPAEDLPPTYVEATAAPSIDPETGLPPHSPLTTHLRTLPARLRASQRARQTAQAARDADLTALLVPHVEAFLADLAAMPRVPPAAELTLVPAAAVPPASSMSGAAERNSEGEVVRVARVDVDAVVGAEGKGESGKGGADKGRGHHDDESGGSARERGFDEWGRFDTEGREGREAEEAEKALWFRDEDMARRIAVYLRPEPNLARKQVQAAVAEQKAAKEEKSGWGRWGFRSKGKKDAEQRPPLVSPPASPALPSGASAAEDDSAKMTVKPEEVTFRHENEFGVWESRTGWGIVVTVRIKP